MAEMISGVHNYCFRWCERCPFTDRCSTYAMTQEFEKEPNQEIPAVFPIMSQAFSSYWPPLRQIVAAQSLDWSSFSYGLDQQSAVGNLTLTHDEARKLSKSVSIDMLHLSRDQPDWLPPTEDYETELGQAVACFRWYGLMIGAKFARILGSTSQDAYVPDLETDRPTAKLLHLILARVIASTAVIMQQRPDSIGALLPLLKTYCRLMHYLRIHYPKAYLSQRTAFDNPRYAEQINSFYEGHLPIDPFRDNSWSAGGRAPSE